MQTMNEQLCIWSEAGEFRGCEASRPRGRCLPLAVLLLVEDIPKERAADDAEAEEEAHGEAEQQRRQQEVGQDHGVGLERLAFDIIWNNNEICQELLDVAGNELLGYWSKT